MPKAKTLTGGTGDVNPQWFRTSASYNGPTITPGSENYFTTQAPVPINRLQQQGGKAIVMEILKIRWQLRMSGPLNPAQTEFSSRVIRGWLATTAPKAGNLGSPYNTFPLQSQIIDFQNSNQTTSFNQEAQTVLTGGPLIISGQICDSPVYHDLTDGAGHGVLVATDNIYVTGSVQVTNFGGDATPTISLAQVECDLLYRFKEITLQEYIGIVQSQQ